MSGDKILVVGGYGEVGRRLAQQLEARQPGRVIVGGRHPEQASGVEARRIDVDDPGSIELALEGVGVVVACVRQRELHLVRAAIRHGIAYTSIAPPWMPWLETEPLRKEAERTGARIILAAGLEPGITSVLVRAAADRLGGVDAVETALLLGLGDAYGADSMAFIFDELSQAYSVVVDGRARSAMAFERPTLVEFPPPVGLRRAYPMPFRDQLYYPATVGAKTAIARIALDPPWLASTLSALLRLGARRVLGRSAGRGSARRLIETLRARYSGCDRYALVVDVRNGRRTIRSTLTGRSQAHATAVGVGAVTEALWSREADTAGVWLAEQVIAPEPFLARLADQGIVPTVSGYAPLPRGARSPSPSRDRPSGSRSRSRTDSD